MADLHRGKVVLQEIRLLMSESRKKIMLSPERGEYIKK
jgi:hypothetical protein